MNPSRRRTLAILGGGFVLAAGGAAVDLTVGPAKALEPWSRAGTYSDPRMNALSYAILSPNPHNRQPWLVDLSTEDQITLYADPDRLLPHTDPFARQITIGLGCFLETLRMALAEQGRGVQVDLFPDGENPEALTSSPVAIIRLHGDATPDPLFAHVMERRTQKDAYDTNRDVSDAMLDLLTGIAGEGVELEATNDPETVEALRELAAQAFEIEFRTPHTYRESVDLFRIGRGEINENPDGIDLGGAQFQLLHRLGLFTREATLRPDSFGFTTGLDMVQSNVRTAMAHIWLRTDGNTRADQIRAGRDWMRLNLATTQAGIGLHPLSQALQEFPEMSELYGEAHNRLAPDGGTVQMWARLGYCAPVPVSPRWPVEAKLLNG